MKTEDTNIMGAYDQEAAEEEHEGKTEEAEALEQKAEALKTQLREEKVIELGEEEVEQEGDGLDECLLGCPNANKETFKVRVLTNILL